MSDLSETLATAFADETDEAVAQEAAENIAAFAEEYDEDLTSDRVTDLLADAPYDGFDRQFNWVIGELAAENEDCTDSRPFRIDGFGELAADPDIGT
ncbi:hypothetical protein [Haloarcula sp. CGMCC 1.2071]|uniref:hypothetical protein n=1 Tax=Haloarcula sp. CGMCC 1.2071 TaxID=3111454 RepID=UPI00300EEE79